MTDIPSEPTAPPGIATEVSDPIVTVQVSTPLTSCVLRLTLAEAAQVAAALTEAQGRLSERWELTPAAVAADQAATSAAPRAAQPSAGDATV